MQKMFPNHPVFKEFETILASNHSLSGLLGLPESDPSVDAIAKAMHVGSMFNASSSDPGAQNAINPITGQVFPIKTENPE